MILVTLILALAGGCQEPEVPAAASAPPSTFTGPQFLRGTVGSMAYLANYGPLLVSGFGVVVLPEPTGSGEVPPFLRQHLINLMRKRGVGSVKYRDILKRTPEQMLADPRTAIVEVYGLIPPGSVPGSRFDLLVKAYRQTQTTSLAGGWLYTLTLTIDGTNPALPFRKPVAEGGGGIYIDPFREGDGDKTRDEHLREAVVIAGGKAASPQQIRLLLNQPSFRRSRLISDRINERFSRTDDRHLIAMPQNERVITIWIPPRWQGKSERLLALISCLYVQGGEGFELRKARQLVQVIRQVPEYTKDVVNTLRALGRSVTPVLQDHYEDADPNLQLAVLEAGSWLGDERAGQYLHGLSLHPEAAMRRRVAEVLVFLPRSIDGTRALQALLNDSDRSVCLAAYESLAANYDPFIDRFPIMDETNRLKLVIDRVPAENSLIYVTHASGVPRLVIFDRHMAFRTPMVARLWDGRLMLKASAADEPLLLFYQGKDHFEGRTYKLNPTVATLAFMLAHRPSMEQPQEGLDLTYAEVIDAIYNLVDAGHIDADLQLDLSPLIQAISESEGKFDEPEIRPEFEPTTQRREVSDGIGSSTAQSAVVVARSDF